MTKILVTGGNGLVGANLISYINKLSVDYQIFSAYFSLPTNFEYAKNVRIDINDERDLETIKHIDPDIIVHCAALTEISYCEANAEKAYFINVEGTKNIALASRNCKAKLVYLSTDSVFDGVHGNYSELDIPNPLHVYGKTKLAGEKECLNINPNSLIVRTNLFGKNIYPNKKSFVESIIHNLEHKKPYSAFADCYFNPLYVDTLSKYVLKLVENDSKGIFHVVGSETLSKYDFAVKICTAFAFEKNLVKKSSVLSLPDFIKRPRNTTLLNKKLLSELGIEFTESINEMINEFKSNW